MASDVGIGDIELPHLDVQPGDGTTAGSFTVTDPDGNVSDAITATAGTPEDGVVRLTADEVVTYDQAGRWVLHWTVTETGAGEEDVEVYVVASPVAGGPTWTPGRSRVANYVPGRTLARDSETHQLTFDSTTLPTGVQCDRLIADGVALVASRVGTVDESLYDAAAVTVALYAAASVERGYPALSEEQSLARARDLERQMQAALSGLISANQSPDSQGSALLPRYSFPGAVEWGDELFI